MDMTILFLLILALLFLTVFLGFSQSVVMFVNRFPALKKKAKDYQYKERLRRVVYRYRLSQMLHYIGIRVEDYVNRIPSPEVKKQIMACKRCTNIKTCDMCLRDGMFINDMHFCPNYKSLMTYSKIMPPVE
jgi:hypothetical protein